MSTAQQSRSKPQQVSFQQQKNMKKPTPTSGQGVTRSHLPRSACSKIILS